MKTMKSKQQHKRSLVAHISEERILGLSNDLSEVIASGNVREWRAVALYFRQQLDALQRKLNAVQPSIAALCTGGRMMTYGIQECQAWLDRYYPPPPIEQPGEKGPR